MTSAYPDDPEIDPDKTEESPSPDRESEEAIPDDEDDEG